jgi:hypothetical protein
MPKMYGLPTGIQSERAFETAMHNTFTRAITQQLFEHGLVSCLRTPCWWAACRAAE